MNKQIKQMNKQMIKYEKEYESKYISKWQNIHTKTIKHISK